MDKKSSVNSRKYYSNKDMLRIYTENAYKLQKGKCYWCNSKMLPFEDRKKDNNPLCPTTEHLLPIILGGLKTSPTNIVCACRDCNSVRSCNMFHPITQDPILV